MWHSPACVTSTVGTAGSNHNPPTEEPCRKLSDNERLLPIRPSATERIGELGTSRRIGLRSLHGHHAGRRVCRLDVLHEGRGKTLRFGRLRHLYDTIDHIREMGSIGRSQLLVLPYRVFRQSHPLPAPLVKIIGADILGRIAFDTQAIKRRTTLGRRLKCSP